MSGIPRKAALKLFEHQGRDVRGRPFAADPGRTLSFSQPRLKKLYLH